MIHRILHPEALSRIGIQAQAKHIRQIVGVPHRTAILSSPAGVVTPGRNERKAPVFEQEQGDPVGPVILTL
jgi:hypothetical protein